MALTPEQTVERIIEQALDKKAVAVRVLDLRALSAMADYFVICSGTSELHIKAVVDGIEEALSAAGVEPWHIEGYFTRRWVLMDYVDVVVHVFTEEARTFYGLERLWGDAPVRTAGAEL